MQKLKGRRGDKEVLLVGMTRAETERLIAGDVCNFDIFVDGSVFELGFVGAEDKRELESRFAEIRSEMKRNKEGATDGN